MTAEHTNGATRGNGRSSSGSPELAAPLPAEAGFRMPAEWEPHAATWLSWPINPETWPGKLFTIPPVYAQMVRTLSPHEKVCINVDNREARDEAEKVLRYYDAWNENVELIIHPHNDSWARDHGPVFVTNGKEMRLINWEYNAWGGKYPPYDKDNEIPVRIAERLGMKYWSPGIVMEGGSIDVNGRGTLLTTEACLLNENRNPHLNREQIEQYLRDYLGVRQVLWLGDGIVGDDTDGHVDDITRFCDAHTIVTVVEENPADENYEPLQENLSRLKKMTDPDGLPFNIVELPMPDAVWYEDRRLPASYANFYIANNVVLMPAYNCGNDTRAASILQSCFPGRKIVPIDCTDLVWGLGAFHCITQQQPAL